MSSASNGYIVTGAAGGVGSQAVRQLVEKGYRVLAVDRDEAGLKVAAEATGAPADQLFYRAADVSSEDDVRAYVDAAIERFGGLNGVFNIAGIEGQFFKSGEASIENFDRVMSINARSVFLNMLFAIPELVRQGGGTIVNTGSHLAWHGAATLGAYCASKHAVMGLTRAAALEYATDGIRVNCVCPSAIDTEMSVRVADAIDPTNRAAGMQVLVDQAPNERLANPSEVAAVGVWLLTEAPAHINGILVPVDGGQAAA